MSIVWKDIFRPRYAIIVEIDGYPDLGALIEGRPTKITRFPVVRRVPVRRPLSVPFNVFYSGISSMGNLVFCGSKRSIGSLYGIGSCLPHNMKNAQIFKPKTK